MTFMLTSEIINRLYDIYDDHYGISEEVDRMRSDLRELIEELEEDE